MLIFRGSLLKSCRERERERERERKFFLDKVSYDSLLLASKCDIVSASL